MYRKKILLAIVLLVFIGGASFSTYVYVSVFSSNTSFEEERVAVYIPSNPEPGRLSKALFPFLENPNTFLRVAKQKGYLSQLRGGKYLIQKGMSNNDIVNVLRSKPETIKLSFNNVERLEDLAAKVSKIIEADSISLMNAFLDVKFLDQNEFSPQTALSMYVPNTYDLFWNTSAEGFRDRMLKEYRIFWNEKRMNQAASIGLSPLEVSVLAAIVHKESVKKDERPRVAGVYLNRLKKNIKLQADPTVIFALKHTQNDFDQIINRVLYKDLKIDSPYNTYMNKGLPPGPIFMADISAIDAVLKPEKHDFIFFVADTSRFGYHIFAKTLRQHNNNKRQYVRWLNERKISR
ncbi:MAG: endolytic transglycosylase MltG [Flavobacteriia bacterium]|nr:endolytic transglycosylase MltG [Flavobacteriia bacterium]